MIPLSNMVIISWKQPPPLCSSLLYGITKTTNHESEKQSTEHLPYCIFNHSRGVGVLFIHIHSKPTIMERPEFLDKRDAGTLGYPGMNPLEMGVENTKMLLQAIDYIKHLEKQNEALEFNLREKTCAERQVSTGQENTKEAAEIALQPSRAAVGTET